MINQQERQNAQLLNSSRKQDNNPNNNLEQRPIISVNDFGEIHLFLISFADKLLDCSKYRDTPNNTKKILEAMTNPDKNMKAEDALLEVILSKPIPRNESFAKLLGSRSTPPDLIFELHGEKFKAGRAKRLLSQASAHHCINLGRSSH